MPLTPGLSRPEVSYDIISDRVLDDCYLTEVKGQRVRRDTPVH